MKRVKHIVALLASCVTLSYCGQSTIPGTGNETGSHTYKALAKLISFEAGGKIHVGKFEIIKDLSDSTFLSDTITVGYYNYKQPDNITKGYVLLTLKKYDGQTALKNYFICPDYDGKAGIQNAKINFIDFEYWEDCETGKGDCKTLNFERQKDETNWFLIMPCGGTETAITISGQNFNKELHLFHVNCPPYLDLSKLKDGNYSASMRACGLGGTVTFNLTTRE